MKVAYQGVPGAFSQMALREYFANQTVEEVPYREFVDMLKDLAEGRIDAGLFPVENTTTGLIARTYDYFADYPVWAIGEISIPIRENLIGFPGVKEEEIKEVYSHPEALSQCRKIFLKHPAWNPVVYDDTALSVRYIKECNDPSKAALASALAAQLYGMEILEKNVQDNQVNTTRFLVLSSQKTEVPNADKVSIMMTLKHEPGALYHALGLFAMKNINVLKLESRPIIGKMFEYNFYLDFNGNLNDPDVAETLRRLRYDALDLKIFGNYKAYESGR